MNSTTGLQKAINRTWSTQQLCRRHGVTPMTIHAWRARGLPAIEVKGDRRPAIRFVPKEANLWIKSYLKGKR